jgi:hypothetical protein
MDREGNASPAEPEPALPTELGEAA